MYLITLMSHHNFVDPCKVQADCCTVIWRPLVVISCAPRSRSEFHVCKTKLAVIQTLVLKDKEPLTFRQLKSS